MNDLLQHLDVGHVAILTLLDLSSAFDTIDHQILIRRLECAFGIKGAVLTWIESYLTERTQAVVVEGHSSDPAPLRFGVPQGSVLGPLLFSLYTQPLSQVIQKHAVSHISYADDTQLYDGAPVDKVAEVVGRLQSSIADIKSWMTT